MFKNLQVHFPISHMKIGAKAKNENYTYTKNVSNIVLESRTKKTNHFK